MTKTSPNARVEPESFMGQKAFNKNRANLAPSNRRRRTILVRQSEPDAANRDICRAILQPERDQFCA